MAATRRKIHELLRLLPTGAAGLSMSLAAADASAIAVSGPIESDRSVVDRLEALRAATWPARSINMPRVPSRSSPSILRRFLPGGATAGATAAGTMAASATAAGTTAASANW